MKEEYMLTDPDPDLLRLRGSPASDPLLRPTTDCQLEVVDFLLHTLPLEQIVRRSVFRVDHTKLTL